MCRIGGTVRVDLQIDDEHLIDRRIREAADAPAGADVILLVRSRQFPPPWSIRELCREGRHLGSITVQCSDPATISTWVRLMRGGAG